VPAFDIDVAEVDHTRWSACANAGRCRTLPDSEPGLPVTGVTPDEAAEYCRFAGGQLPTSDEWVLAAAGDASRRFPWGNTGLVCRRAAYGLVRGPCAQQGVGPELPGSRPDGATPTGIVDLIGNVAEWSREPNGKAVARGGSFRSRVVSQLRTWSFEPLSSAADHVGFRCVYAPNPPQPNSAAALDGGSAEP
jgi:formylglycine-generating enzyme required for sulfatase activity